MPSTKITDRDLLNIFFDGNEGCMKTVSELTEDQARILLETILICQKYHLEFPK